MIQLPLSPSPSAPAPGALAARAGAPKATADATLADGLTQHRDALFRWALAHFGPGSAAARHAFIEAALAARERPGPHDHGLWLYQRALHLAAKGPVVADLSGLPPELRGILRLVQQGALPVASAWALHSWPLETVRAHLVRQRGPWPSPAARNQIG